MSFVLGYDATGNAADKFAVGAQMAGYTTEVPNPDGSSPGIRWSDAQWARFTLPPVRICQDAGATDTTADVLDVEQYAATIADIPGWFTAALANYHAGTRPGQRYPAIYASASLITPIANELVAAGITDHGPALWVAHWGVAVGNAETAITDNGPYPIIGQQYDNGTDGDFDVWLSSWLDTVSVAPGPQVPDVVGKPGNDALAALVAAGYLAHLSTQQPVVSQTPAAGTPLAPGQTVNLGV